MNLSSRWATSLLAMLLALSAPLSAQQGLGWLTDPHAGISGAFLQPAATSATPYNWDLTLGGAGFNIRNNFVFLENTAGYSFLRQAASAQESTFSETEFSFALDGQRYGYGFPAGDRPIYASLSAEIVGPAFSVQIGDYTRIGAFSRIRSIASVNNLDAGLNYYPYDAVAEGVNISINESYLAATAWGEVGLHLSRAFALGYDGELRIGVSPKYLIGFEGASAANPTGSSIRQLPGDSIIVSNLSADIAFTNGFRQTDNGNGASGTGFATDLGVQYAWGETNSSGHRYTIGLSILDLGSITFDQGAQAHRFTNTGEVLLAGEDYNIDNDENYTDEAILQLSRDVFDGGTNSLVGTSFSMRLPAAISAQFSAHPIDELQLSAIYRGDLPWKQQQLSQGSQLLAAAHFSKWWYGAGLTAGIYDWDKVNIGLQVRLGPLYFGTDELTGTFLKRKELSSGSLYLGLRMHDFGGKKRGRGRKAKRGGGAVRCYDF